MQIVLCRIIGPPYSFVFAFGVLDSTKAGLVEFEGWTETSPSVHLHLAPYVTTSHSLKRLADWPKRPICFSLMAE